MKFIRHIVVVIGMGWLVLALSACAGGIPARAGESGGVDAPGPTAGSGLDIQAALQRLRDYDGRRSFQTTRIYDRNGHLLDEIYGEGRRTWVPLAEIPESLKQAVVATEDATFYSNTGVDPLAIGRAFWQNTQAGEIVSGGSTITQQLVRLIVFPYEERVRQSVSRKINESLLATQLTQMWSKDRILEAYLNEIYFGQRAYGVGAAAEAYFNKPISELTPAESAMLAGLPQAPSVLDPYINFEGARRRQKDVLRLMVEAGYLTSAEAEAIYAQELQLEQHERQREAPHFVDYVLQVLEEAYGRDTVRQGGLQVTTTLDPRYQELAEEIARRHVTQLRDAHNLSNAAVVVMQPRTGEILAMVGSVDYDDPDIDGQVNMAVRPRQPGSAIKPITYAAAFEQGLTPATIVWDIPTSFPLDSGETYEPNNYDDRFHGPVRVRDALANSYNVPAVKVLNAVGLQTMVDKAHAMGITGLRQDPYNYYGLALTLGGGEVSLLDLSTAYATLANGGGHVPRTPVRRIVDGAGDIIYERGLVEPTPAVDPGAAYLVTDILSDAEARRPAFGANNPLELNRPAAVKTGTTSDFRDNWTIGYTPDVVVGVWTGNADNAPMQDVSGVDGAAPLWREVMEAIFRISSLQDVLRIDGQPLVETYPRPDSIVEAEACAVDDLRAGRGCVRRYTELFVEGNVPDADADYGEVTVAQMTALRTVADADGALEPVTVVCRVTDPANLPPGAAIQAVQALYPPRDDEREELNVAEWAARNGVPLADGLECSPDLLLPPVDQDAPVAAASAASWQITSPAPGDVIDRNIPIRGTVVFDPNQVSFYKLEFAAARAPTQWITLGDTHTTTIVDGQLETWYAAALKPGSYTLRLVLVKPDGNWLPPYEVPVRVAQ